MRLKVCVMSVEAALVYWNFGSRMLLKAIAASSFTFSIPFEQRSLVTHLEQWLSVAKP